MLRSFHSIKTLPCILIIKALFQYPFPLKYAQGISYSAGRKIAFCDKFFLGHESLIFKNFENMPVLQRVYI
jgi:hypothetical protein